MRKDLTVERQGKTFALYAGLLDEAHSQGLKRIHTALIQVPCDENGNVAIVFAEVETEKGSFTGLGDASPGNVGPIAKNALIRMAETRAKGRALRDAVNVGAALLEELDDDGHDQPAPRPPTPLPRPQNAPASRPVPSRTPAPVEVPEDQEKPIFPDDQADYETRLRLIAGLEERVASKGYKFHDVQVKFQATKGHPLAEASLKELADFRAMVDTWPSR